jgi:hypothetical protein
LLLDLALASNLLLLLVTAMLTVLLLLSPRVLLLTWARSYHLV